MLKIWSNVLLCIETYFALSHSSSAVVNLHLGDSCWVTSSVFPQVWPGPSLFLWRERCLQAGDLWRGDLLEISPKEITEDHRLCSVPFPWMWPLLRQLLGHRALLQAYHHHRQVFLLMFRVIQRDTDWAYLLKNVKNPTIPCCFSTVIDEYSSLQEIDQQTFNRCCLFLSSPVLL